MTTPYLFSPPPKYILPLAEGGDLAVDFQNNPSGDQATFVDNADGVTVTLVIDTTVPITSDANITGYYASVYVPSATTDTVSAGTGWRLVVATPGTPNTTDIVAAYSTVKRFDG
jgi:hypothetical protein